MGQVVFLPLSRADAVTLRDSGVLPGAWPAHAATPSLMRLHDYDAAALEDAEYAALTYAGVLAALTGTDALRLVVAAEVPGSACAGTDDAYGLVSVQEPRWAAVRALFADEPGAGAALAAVRSAAADRPLSAVLDLPVVESLVEQHDLLWYAPEELDALPVTG